MTLDLKHLREVATRAFSCRHDEFDVYRSTFTPSSVIALLDEIERLRAVLTEIEDACPATCELSSAHTMAGIATEARAAAPTSADTSSPSDRVREAPKPYPHCGCDFGVGRVCATHTKLEIKAVAQAICTALGDDWFREGPRGLLPAYGLAAIRALAMVATSPPAPDHAELIAAVRGIVEHWPMGLYPTIDRLHRAFRALPDSGETL